MAALKLRYFFAVLGSIGMAIIYGLKVNLSVAIVAMVNQTAVNAISADSHHSSETDHADNNTLSCMSHHISDSETVSNETSSSDGPLVWTQPQQGLVLGSYFWGYFVTQVPGGRLSELYSAKLVFLVAVFLNIFGAILSPVCAMQGPALVIVMRVIQGLGGGVTFPAMNVLIASWAPKNERSVITSIIYGGTALGTVISLPTSGFIAANPSLGWEGIFYLHGGLSIIWCIAWTVFVSDSPATNRFLSVEEKEFIVENQPTKAKSAGARPPIPFKSIATSIPFWALLFAHMLNNFAWYMLLVELPTFLSVGLGFAISENAVLSAVPFFMNWLFSIFYSGNLDKAISKQWMSRTNARKLSQIIASVIPAFCLVGVCLAGCDSTVVVALMIVGTTAFGTMFSGVFSNHTDIASNFAGTLIGITNMMATIPGFLVPAMVGAMTHGVPGLGPWHQIFYLTAGLLLLEAVEYGLFASAEEQAWNNVGNAMLTDKSAVLEEAPPYSPEETLELKKNEENDLEVKDSKSEVA